MRQDIQCLRGLAILFVLSFHLAPNLFVNGFLGVDIFFVISGFLMAKILTNLDLLKYQDFLLFYYKRFRRILPLYFLSIFLIVIMVHLYLPDFLWSNNNRYSLASLFLITNQLVIHDQADYFNELATSIFITVLGFTGFIMILDKFAFNFLFLRLWQFSAGFTALFWIKICEAGQPKNAGKEETPKLRCPFTKDDLVIVALAILALCLIPNFIYVSVLRPMVTVATALIIGCRSENLRYSIRNDSFWSYKYEAETKKIIDLNRESYAPLYDFETRRGKCMEKTMDVPFEKNQLLGYCRFPPGKGNVSVMMIGNSYILNFVDQIEEHFKLNYSEFRYLSIIASYGTFSSSWEISQQALEISKKQVELHKPDVLFIVPRYMQNIKNPIEENDKLVEEMNKNIEFYEKFTKRIYILDALPQYSENFFTLFLHYLIMRPEDMEMLHLNKKKADLDMKNVRKRLRMIKCEKCQLFDLSRVFLENDKYLTFDRNSMLSYVDNSVHLTSAGVAPCDPIFRNITKEILNQF